MALKFKSYRSKSTSNILDEVVANRNEKVTDNSSVNNRYRTYTIKDLEKEKRCFAKTSSCERERKKGQKSQNFVKKLLTSLERKNEVCKADDEFVAKYYRRNDHATSNSNCFRSDVVRQNSCRIERNEDRNHPRARMNEKCSMNRNLDIVSRNKPTVSANRKIGEQFSFVNYGKNNDAKESILKNFHREESVFRTNDEHRRGHRDENYVHSLCGELSRHSQTRETDLGTNENYERERFHNCSSFDPNRAPVKLDNRRDSFDSCILRTSNTLERIFTNSKEECDVTPNGRLKKKRQRSFKDFLGSMVGWKKSETKEKPRRFMSCEHLMKETKTIDSKNVKVLSRASSLKAVNEDNWIWVKQIYIKYIYF